MFSNLSQKKKFHILIIAILLLTIVGYNLAIKDTIMLSKECYQLQLKIKSIEIAPKKINLLKSELKKFEVFIQENDSISIHSLRQKILDITANYCQNNTLTLIEFNQPITVEKNNFIIETNIITLQGGFHKLLLFVFNLEKKYSLGKVSSVKFSIFKDFKKNQDFLHATIYLQNIKRK